LIELYFKIIKSLEIVELENVKKVTGKNDRIDITNPQKYFKDKKLTPSASHKKMNLAGCKYNFFF
jgi:hypothetical protein